MLTVVDSDNNVHYLSAMSGQWCLECWGSLTAAQTTTDLVIHLSFGWHLLPHQHFSEPAERHRSLHEVCCNLHKEDATIADLARIKQKLAALTPGSCRSPGKRTDILKADEYS